MPDLAARLPRSLVRASAFVRLGPAGIPALVATPPDASGPVPMLLWMHGRTVTKELDPGRYLRLIRAGIGVCAVDLPGHGERFDPELQRPERTLDVVLQMAEEIDAVTLAALDYGDFDPERVAIGGMSAGGMATLTRLTSPHRFVAAAVEATTGSWRHQSGRAMFDGVDPAFVARHDPIQNLDRWRPIPLQAIHTRADEWVDFDGQAAFVNAIRARSTDPSTIDWITYDETGAPFEHAGFGRMAAEAKNHQRDFLTQHLLSH